jgi:hypothetical protein
MRRLTLSARRALLLAVLFASGWTGAALAQPNAPDRIGPYRIERGADGLLVRAADPSRSAQALIAGGLALAAVGAYGVRAARRRGRAAALFLLGVGVAGVGAVAGAFGGTTWLANRDGLTERTRLGGERFVARSELAALERRKQRQLGTEAKSAAPLRLWALELRSTRGARVAHFALESEAEARALGDELARALGVELH